MYGSDKQRRRNTAARLNVAVRMCRYTNYHFTHNVEESWLFILGGHMARRPMDSGGRYILDPSDPTFFGSSVIVMQSRCTSIS